MHAIEKIICRNAKRNSISGESFIDVEVDFTILNDLYNTTISSFEKLKPNLKIFNQKKFGICFNYFSVPPTQRSLGKKAVVDKLVAANELDYQFDIYRGTWQEEFINEKLAWCGEIVLSADQHTPALGGLGIYALSGGESDIAASMATGRTWLRVPEIVEVRLNGEVKPGISPLDAALYVIKNIDRTNLTFKVIEFTGSYIEAMDAASRVTFCNLFSELEVQTCYMEPSGEVLRYLERKNGRKCEPITSDSGYKYSETYEYDMSEVVPMISLSSDYNNILTVKELEEQNIKITEGFIGSCQSGQTKDIEPVYDAIKGKTLPDKSTLTICPASNVILRECMNLGFIKAFEDAGVKCIGTGCASCLGMREDALSIGNPILTNTNRIFCGRMKVEKVKLYQASSLTIATSVMNGYISTPIE